MISAIFTGAGEGVTGFGELLLDSADAVIDLFWTGTALTALGSLAVLGLGIGALMFVFRLIQQKMRVR